MPAQRTSSNRCTTDRTTSPDSRTRKHLGPRQRHTTVFALLTAIQMKLIPMSRSEVAALTKDQSFQLMVHLGEAQPRREALVLKSMIKEPFFSKGGEQEKPFLGFAKRNWSLVYENHTRGHLTKIIREDLLQQSTPKGSDNLGVGKYGAKTYKEVLQMDRDHCNWVDHVDGGSTISLETQEILDVAEDAECLSGNKSGKMTQEWMTRQLEEETIRGNASIGSSRSKAQDSQTERSQLRHSVGGREQRAEGTSQEVDGTSTTTDGFFARAWARRDRPRTLRRQTLATTMSTVSTEETSW